MTTDYGISHEQARSFLHTGRRHLNGGEAKQLDAHLGGCEACRAYAAHMASMEPALTAALRARWDAAQPPLAERAFTEQVRKRVARPQRTPPNWLSAAPLTAGVALLVLVVVWLGSWWGSNSAGPQPTEMVVTYDASATPPLAGLSGEILFSGATGPNADIPWGIYALPAEGGALVNLAPFAQQTYGGTWSPDGQWIAFIGREFCCLEVYVMRADGSDMHRVSPAGDTDWEYLQPISWSPDGQTLAVARRLARTDVEDHASEGEIILIPLDGSGFRPLGPGISPKWSPDGSRIAYLRAGDDGMNLFTSRPDGTDERQVSELTLTANSAFDWSPDGAALALIGSTALNELELRLALLPDNGEQVLAKLDADANASTHLHWSPTGANLLFDANLPFLRPLTNLYVFGVETRELLLALPDVSGDFSWSPDGRHFVAADGDGANLYIFSVDFNGDPMTLGMAPEVEDLNPQWQPDPEVLAAAVQVSAASTPDLPATLLRRWVAFVTRDAAVHDEIYVMRTDGSDGQRLTGLPDALGYDHSLAWSPDGTRLAFVSDRSGQPEVYVTEAGVWIADQLTASDPALAATDYSVAWSPDGAWLAVTVLPEERGPEWAGGEIYLLASRGLRQPFPSAAVRVASRVTDPAQWSPDGAWLAYGGLDENTLPALYAVNVAGAMNGAAPDPAVDLPVQLLTSATAAPEAAHDIYLGYAWSRDGRHVVYLQQGPWVGGLFDAHMGADFSSSIEWVGLDLALGPGPVSLFRLSPSPNGIMGLSWSPDSQYLLYLSDAVTGVSLDSGTASTGCWTPRLLPAEGSEPVALVGACYVTRTALPQWSADSRYLLFTAEDGLVISEVPVPLTRAWLAQPKRLLLPLPADVEGFPHSPAWQP